MPLRKARVGIGFISLNSAATAAPSRVGGALCGCVWSPCFLGSGVASLVLSESEHASPRRAASGWLNRPFRSAVLIAALR